MQLHKRLSLVVELHESWLSNLVADIPPNLPFQLLVVAAQVQKQLHKSVVLSLKSKSPTLVVVIHHYLKSKLTLVRVLWHNPSLLMVVSFRSLLLTLVKSIQLHLTSLLMVMVSVLLHRQLLAQLVKTRVVSFLSKSLIRVLVIHKVTPLSDWKQLVKWQPSLLKSSSGIKTSSMT